MIYKLKRKFKMRLTFNTNLQNNELDVTFYECSLIVTDWVIETRKEIQEKKIWSIDGTIWEERN